MRRFVNIVASALFVSALALGPCAAQTGSKAPEKAAPKTAVAAADQCTAMTQAGTRCKRKAQAGSKFCWQHDPANKGKKKKA
ncbi:hypothetical protein [uncultured Paludibaculum sp.]|uniref:hypothetical protein n=1 Tax=uncultured Paludibaculum sp. TaxID=1765020 RepID=UPI002AAB6E6F|nr:hypothetical protein [uncultured Paludibaculum sp.]